MIKSESLPKDICLGEIRVTLTGNFEAWVENYKGLLRYNDKCVVVQGKDKILCIEGECLSIACYTFEDMIIQGRICNIKYQ